MYTLSDPIANLHLVKPESRTALHRLGILTVEDLLFYFPKTWQDLSHIQKIIDIRPGERINLKTLVKKISSGRSRFKRLHITEALLQDDTGNVVAIWFNQPFIKNSLFEGRQYYITGKAVMQARGGSAATIQLQNPAFELVKEETIHTAGIVPLYDLTEGITQKQIRYWLKQALPSTALIQEYLPKEILTKFTYPVLPECLIHIHFPKNLEQLELARDRLAFDELFLFQLALQSFKKKLKILPSPKIKFDVTLIKNFVAGLPFALTNSQRLAVWEILKDLEKPYPMNRLLEGEVGSGKTVVAGLAMLAVAKAGWQSILLAPTEILALQHYQTLSKLLEKSGLQIALLTRGN